MDEFFIYKLLTILIRFLNTYALNFICISNIFYVQILFVYFKKGMGEMEKLGKIFRQRYILERPLLTEQYTPKEVGCL